MRQRDTLTKRCIEHCFVFVHFELDTLKVIQRPHVLVVEEDMGLRNERLAIGADEALILHHINQVPPMIAGFPLAFANQAAHSRRFANSIRKPTRWSASASRRWR